MKSISSFLTMRCGLISLILIVVSACANTDTTLGEGGSMVSGSAGAAGNQKAATELVKCSRPIGTAALVEPDTQYMAIFSQYGLQSPVPLVKLMMAQSGCFQVVNRGAASKALERERALASGGELQKGSNMGGGQMVAADYLVTPTIVNRDSDAGGSFGGLGGLLPGSIGAIAGALGVKSLEAQAMLDVTNVRSGVQEAIATGSASKNDMSFGGFGIGGGVAGVGGGYESTDIGKIVTAAFLDAFNNLVTQLDATAIQKS